MKDVNDSRNPQHTGAAQGTLCLSTANFPSHSDEHWGPRQPPQNDVRGPGCQPVPGYTLGSAARKGWELGLQCRKPLLFQTSVSSARTVCFRGPHRFQQAFLPGRVSSWGEGRAGAILPNRHRHPRVSTQQRTGLGPVLRNPNALHGVPLAESRHGGPEIMCVSLPCVPGVQASAWGFAEAVLGGVRSAAITYEPVTSAASILLCPPHSQGLSGPLAQRGHPPWPLFPVSRTIVGRGHHGAQPCGSWPGATTGD